MRSLLYLCVALLGGEVGLLNAKEPQLTIEQMMEKMAAEAAEQKKVNSKRISKLEDQVREDPLQALKTLETMVAGKDTSAWDMKVFMSLVQTHHPKQMEAMAKECKNPDLAQAIRVELVRRLAIKDIDAAILAIENCKDRHELIDLVECLVENFLQRDAAKIYPMMIKLLPSDLKQKEDISDMSGAGLKLSQRKSFRTFCRYFLKKNPAAIVKDMQAISEDHLYSTVFHWIWLDQPAATAWIEANERAVENDRHDLEVSICSSLLKQKQYTKMMDRAVKHLSRDQDPDHEFSNLLFREFAKHDAEGAERWLSEATLTEKLRAVLEKYPVRTEAFDE